MQARGWRDPRDFDNLVWELPIPEFDAGSILHQELAAAAEAEATAEAVELPDGDYRQVVIRRQRHGADNDDFTAMTVQQGARCCLENPDAAGPARCCG